jgi:hypothetical protein
LALAQAGDDDAPTSADATASAPPKFVKACGSVSFEGSRLQVDIAEGRLPTKCGQARRVMATYLQRTGGGTDDVDGCCSRRIKVGRKEWSCYKARGDGQGWDYHCNRLSNRDGPFSETFVSLAAGRRF